MENEENKEEKQVYVNLKKVPLESEKREIRQRRKRSFLTFLLCLLCLGLGLFVGYSTLRIVQPGYTADARNTLGEIEKIMDGYWLYATDYDDLDSELEDRAFRGMTTFDYDPYTQYMSREEMEEFAESINRDYVGIGVQYSSEGELPMITKVFADSPAERAGLLAGDYIVAVDGTDVSELESGDLRELVIGEEGSEVIVTVLRGNERIDYSVIRGTISLTAYAYLVDDIPVVEISSFGDGTAKEVEKYLEEYRDYDSLIVDVRNNSGGYQTAVRDVCGLFIGDKEVYLRQKGQDGVETVDYTRADKTFSNFDQVVVLTNGNTASAAEVFAIVMKEKYPHTTLVGETTFGKGVIQINRSLSNGGVLKLTAYNWYSPDGVSISGMGLAPDIEVKMPDIYYEEYYMLEDDETLAYDSVDDSVRIAQLCLDFLGYDPGRRDGYFSKETLQALQAYEADKDYANSDVLDKEIYLSLISDVNRVLANDLSRDSQLNKAIEVLHGNYSE